MLIRTFIYPTNLQELKRKIDCEKEEVKVSPHVKTDHYNTDCNTEYSNADWYQPDHYNT